MKTIIYKIENVEYTIEIGQNAKENWDLVDNADLNDLWFHLDNYPSAHIILGNNSSLFNLSDYHNQIISIASNHCKSYSKYGKKLHKVKIVYTQIKNLKKGKEIGSVIVSKPNYIFI